MREIQLDQYEKSPKLSEFRQLCLPLEERIYREIDCVVGKICKIEGSEVETIQSLGAEEAFELLFDCHDLLLELLLEIKEVEGRLDAITEEDLVGSWARIDAAFKQRDFFLQRILAE